MGINPGLIENEVGREIIQHARQRVMEDGKIGGILHPVGQADVQRRARLAHREIFFSMDRQGENIRPPRQQRSRAVALMHVEVEDEDTIRLPFRDQAVGGDGKIIEHAITRPAIGQRVVAAPCGISGKAVDARQPRRRPGAAGRQGGAEHDPLGHRKADPPFLGLRDGEGQHFFHIGGIMHRLYPGARHRIGRVERHGGRNFAQRLHHQPIFVETKAAAGCCGRDIGRMVNDVQHDLFRYRDLNGGRFALSGPA